MIEYFLAVSLMWVSPTGATRSQEFTGTYPSHTACIKAMTDEIAAMEVANGVAPLPVGTELCVPQEAAKRGSQKGGTASRVSREEWASEIDSMQMIMADLLLCKQQHGRRYGDEAERLNLATYRWNDDLGVSFADEELHWDKIKLHLKINRGTVKTIKSCNSSIASSDALQRSFKKLARRR